ncbi:MAG TPA: hypothetical protein ENL22_09120 [candidate division Zixibacteria bacterium]|nr:hypothetical protein [candidate division Zixibacteria bacterium]
MLDDKYQRGFTYERLSSVSEPKVHCDDEGFYIFTLSENVKVYFDDYYNFLKNVYRRCQQELAVIDEKLEITPNDKCETVSFFRAKKIIIEIILKTAKSFYTDDSTFGVIMTPWCFGTVLLEKVEIYRERLAKGEINDREIPEFPYYVIKYIDEIHRKTLLDIFDFPEEAFKMRWQYSELLKRYSKVLTNITKSLNSVLTTIKTYGT